MHEPNLSHAQKAYLARMKRDRRLVISARLLVFLIFTAQWEILARIGWIDSFIFSSPSMILKTFVEMSKDQSLFIHISATLKETLLSFLFVVILGLGISILLWGCKGLAKVLEPYLVILNSLPKSALAPLLIVWLGARQRTIIVAGMSVAIFGSILNLYTGFGEISPEKLKLIRTLGGGKRDELLKIVLPSCIPLILANMKVNIGLCLVGVIIGEFIGARKGLGYLIIYGSQTFQQVCILIVFQLILS
nr:ABC transporter permease [uncultured Blautia sp.]